MLNDQQFNRMLNKVSGLAHIYSPYIYRHLADLEVLLFETKAQYYVPPENVAYKIIEDGDSWGDEWTYGWFKTGFTVPEEIENSRLYLRNGTNASEVLIFLDGAPVGMFDNYADCSVADQRLHDSFLLCEKAEAGKLYIIDLEGYAGHRLNGNMPYETAETAAGIYPRSFPRKFGGISIAAMNCEVYDFVTDLKLVWQWYGNLPDDNYLKWDIANALKEIYLAVIQKPDEYDQCQWQEGIRNANVILQGLLNKKQTDDDTYGYIGLVGHSHLDTAWLWTVDETYKKAARTFSNALYMMDRFPEYKFMQSSVIYLDWMKDKYPQLFTRIKEKISIGQWEPNGGSYVECDGNLPSGEMLIRQFLKGQLFLRDNFNYEADTFWLPDTFGYSAAIPQILRGCNIKYFATTKLSWNDTNRFPYDSFRWSGIDGSEVLTHFNTIHCKPDIETIYLNGRNNIFNKKSTNMKLLCYGYGDGGGGPDAEMIETVRKVKNLKGVPQSEHISVSDFMKKLDAAIRNVPMYHGELYVEGQRGTLTQMHEIKKTNRTAEFSLRNLELLNVLADLYGIQDKYNIIDKLYDMLLLNQFHDILPGTSIEEVNNTAIKENNEIINSARLVSNEIIDKFIGKGNDLVIFNPLSFDRSNQFVIDYYGYVPVDGKHQIFSDIEGEKRLAIKTATDIPSLSFKEITVCTTIMDNKKSVFIYQNHTLETPFAVISFDENGYITGFYDKKADRQLCKSTYPLNTFLCGDDLPAAWDNWDIDADQTLKMNVQNNILSEEVVSDGELQFRIRRAYKIGRFSKLIQDMVFYSDSSKVDFETVIDWRDKHSLLKTVFDCDVTVNSAKTEIQFGFLERNVHSNTTYEQAKFEVVNHKYTELSENNYGVAILNDCKYGISINGSCMQLTLHKGGCHPDTRGDAGVHSFTYTFLPHSEAFSANSVVKPAYELNNTVLCRQGKTLRNISKLLEIDKPNIIIESIKFSEDGQGYIVRLYECERSATLCTIKLNKLIQKAETVNMLENYSESREIENNELKLRFRAFEIKTLKIYK